MLLVKRNEGPEYPNSEKRRKCNDNKELWRSMDDLKRVGAIKYEEFFRDFMETNQLCIFSSELTKDWRSRKEWVKDGKPNFDFLSKEFGNINLVLQFELTLIYFFNELVKTLSFCFA